MTATSDAYLAGLYRELVGKTGDDRAAVLVEIERVGGKVPDTSPAPAKPAAKR